MRKRPLVLPSFWPHLWAVLAIHLQPSSNCKCREEQSYPFFLPRSFLNSEYLVFVFSKGWPSWLGCIADDTSVVHFNLNVLCILCHECTRVAASEIYWVIQVLACFQMLSNVLVSWTKGTGEEGPEVMVNEHSHSRPGAFLLLISSSYSSWFYSTFYILQPQCVLGLSTDSCQCLLFVIFTLRKGFLFVIF